MIQYFLGICLFARFPLITFHGFSLLFYQKGVHNLSPSDAEVVHESYFMLVFKYQEVKIQISEQQLNQLERKKTQQLN